MQLLPQTNPTRAVASTHCGCGIGVRPNRTISASHRPWCSRISPRRADSAHCRRIRPNHCGFRPSGAGDARGGTSSCRVRPSCAVRARRIPSRRPTTSSTRLTEGTEWELCKREHKNEQAQHCLGFEKAPSPHSYITQNNLFAPCTTRLKNSFARIKLLYLINTGVSTATSTAAPSSIAKSLPLHVPGIHSCGQTLSPQRGCGIGTMTKRA